MYTKTLTVALVVACSMLCGCAGLAAKIQAHNDRVEAQRLADEETAGGADGARVEEPAPAPTPPQQVGGKHAPYRGPVKVALFLTFEGELWQDGMQDRAAAMLRDDLAAHAQFSLMKPARLKKLRELKQPQLDSGYWVGQVRDKFGATGPQVLLHVTLRSEEALGRNRKTGKVEKYPKFTATTSYRHIERNACGEFSKSGHVFSNGTIMNELIADFHERTLTEVMPAF